MAKQKYVVASLNHNEDYDSAYPIDVIWVDDLIKLSPIFTWYREHYNYPQIYREGNELFTYQTKTAWHRGETA